MKTISDEELKSLLPGKIRFGPRNHYISDCPFCGKEKHFYIQRDKQLFDCKKCGEEGNIFKLLAHEGKLFLLGEYKSINRKRIELKLVKDLTEEEKEDIEAPKKLLPPGFKRIYENEYLFGRGLTELDFMKYKIGYTSLMSKFEDYLIFSIEEDGICKGFVSRYSGLDKEKDRYSNSRKTNFSKLLFGYDEINKATDTVIAVEGLFDKITLDKILSLDDSPITKAVATFGKKFSKAQIIKLRLKGVQNIILIYDYDAIKEMKKYSVILKKNFSTILVGFTMNKDINASSEKEVLSIFDRLKTVEQFNKQTVSILR